MTGTHRCPLCGDNATELERFFLPSTTGPIEHIRIRCTADHYFMMLIEDLVP